MRRIMISVIGVTALFLSGCASTGVRQKDMEIQRLHTQISAMNAQVQAKDEEISGLKDELSRTQEQSISSGNEYSNNAAEKKEVKSRPTFKQVQKALKNAGYNPGSIDGKFGRQTKEAIKDFQRANNLKPDGKVGKRTWKLLRKFL
ncbi:MAG: peptidoglycan-binding domain-containing protein [Candidatus Omnitrophota bacterium]